MSGCTHDRSEACSHCRWAAMHEYDHIAVAAETEAKRAAATLHAERTAYVEADAERELGATLAREIALREAAGLDCTYQRSRLRVSEKRLLGARIGGLVHGE